MREFFYVFGWFDFTNKGGDRVDADGIPLYTITHWQKAQFLNQGRGINPRSHLLRIGKTIIRGIPGNWNGSS
jgi:hypothetical protein